MLAVYLKVSQNPMLQENQKQNPYMQYALLE